MQANDVLVYFFFSYFSFKDALTHRNMKFLIKKFMLK